MRDVSSLSQIDSGRIVAVTLFAFLLTINGLTIAKANPVSSPMSAIVTVLTMAFYLLLIVAYLRRRPTDKTDRRLTSWAVAIAGTAGALAIPIVSHGIVEESARQDAAVVLLGLGLVAMLWALGALGTNISVIPQAREVISRGPYARVRHPLYAAELVNVIGLCLAHSGPWPWLVLAALVTFQVMRARREEELLSRELPGYVDYKARTPMLVPALGRR